MDVAVVGGGNAGFETAMQLVSYCKSVKLFENGTDFKADKITVDKIITNPKFEGIKNSEILKIKGDKFVSSIVYKNKETGERKRNKCRWYLCRNRANTKHRFCKKIF